MPSAATIRAHENANLVLWCVHTAGPDDLIAARSYEEAVERAKALNEEVFAYEQPNDILCFAFPDIWPWCAESHAEDLLSQI